MPRQLTLFERQMLDDTFGAPEPQKPRTAQDAPEAPFMTEEDTGIGQNDAQDASRTHLDASVIALPAKLVLNGRGCDYRQCTSPLKAARMCNVCLCLVLAVKSQ